MQLIKKYNYAELKRKEGDGRLYLTPDGEALPSVTTILSKTKDKTFIMPAGDTRETLVKMYPLVFELCAEKGYNMTGRDHIIAYDTERGV